MHRSMKILGYVILLLMATAITYGGFIAVKYWSSIAV